MNELDKILKLADLGYTREEINKFLSIGTGPSELEIKTEEPTPTPEPEVPDYSENIKNALDPYLKGIQETLKAIQAANIRGVEMNETPKKTPEEILADVINPKRK